MAADVQATLKRALSQLQRERDQIDRQIATLSTLVGSAISGRRQRRVKKAVRKAVRKGRRMTAAQRKAVSQRMKKYWAARKKKAA